MSNQLANANILYKTGEKMSPCETPALIFYIILKSKNASWIWKCLSARYYLIKR